MKKIIILALLFSLFIVGCQSYYNEDDTEYVEKAFLAPVLTTSNDSNIIIIKPLPQDTISGFNSVIVIEPLPQTVITGHNPYMIPHMVEQRVPVLVPYITPIPEPMLVPKLKDGSNVMVNVTIITEVFVDGKLISTTKNILVNPGVKVR